MIYDIFKRCGVGLVIQAFILLNLCSSAYSGLAYAQDEGAQGEGAVQLNRRTELVYPGVQDEEDLTVQKELRTAVPGLDRRTLDQKVLKSFIKKSESPSTKDKGKTTK